MLFNLFLFLCLYLPFQLALNPSEGIDLASVRIFILLLFFIWLGESLRKKKIIIRENILAALIAIFIFFNLFSVFFAKNTDWSIRKILFLFSVFPIYFVISSLELNKEKIFKIAKYLVLGGTLAGLAGIFEFFLQLILGLNKTLKVWSFLSIPFLGENVSKEVAKNSSWLVNISGETYLRAVAFFPDPHTFSFFLGLLLPVALGLYLRLKNKIYLASFLVLLLADILTFSRGGYLGIFSGAIFALFANWKKIGRKYKMAMGAASFFIILILIIPSPISKRFLSSFDLKEGSNIGRMEMWKKSYEVALDNPIIGVGIGNYPLEVKASADYREPINAHNTYLDIASETGIPNMLVWIFLVFFSAYVFLQKSQKENLFLFFSMGIVIFSVHSIFETAIYSPIVLTLFLIIISLASAKFEDEKTV